jgi:MFS family permease
MQAKIKYYKLTIVVLMLTITLDFMGFLLIFPIFPELFLAKNSLLVSVNSTNDMRYFYYAIALASWPLGNFFGSAFLGMLSDQYGRKRTLMLGLFMVSVTYFIQLLSIHIHMYILFIITRVVQGFFGGNYDIAQAAIVDISSTENKTRNLGMIALAASVGIICGPIISAFTTSSHLLSCFSITTPFLIAGLIACCNLIWVGFIFQETYQSKGKGKIPITKIFTAFTFMLTDKRIKKITMVFFLFSLGWGFYIQHIPVVMQQKFNFSPYELGLFFIVLGCGFIFAMLYLQPILIKKYSLDPLYIYFTLNLTFFIFIAGGLPLLTVEWGTVFIIALCHVSAYGCIMTIASNQVGNDEQGKVMGGMGSIAYLTSILSAILAAYFSLYGLLIPIFVAGSSYFVSGIVMRKWNATYNSLGINKNFS